MEPDEIIRRELTLGPKSRKELVEAQLKNGITRPTAYRRINTLLINGAINEIEGRKGMFAPTHIKLEEINAEEVDYLIDMINKKGSPESVKAALYELGLILRRCKITKKSNIIDFFKKTVEDDYYKNEWTNLIDDLSAITCNLAQIRDDEDLDEIRKTFQPSIINLLEPSQDKPILKSVVHFIETLSPDDACSLIFDKVNTYISDEQFDDLQWDQFISVVLLQLKELYNKDKLKVWRWLFPLMEEGNETAKKRAIKIHEEGYLL
ncbi:MAG: hypothetical protein V1850_02475 [Candidatus Bathyarchaeota archaeon]